MVPISSIAAVPKVKSHTPPITKGNPPGEGKKTKESDFCVMEREKKKLIFRTQFRKTVNAFIAWELLPYS
jgi:hypothetical protein